MTHVAAPGLVGLDDKWTVERGRILINGNQAIARTLLAQSALDRKHGLKTAGYITGYRGSPLGMLDSALWKIADRLQAAEIKFQPGVNEDIAATAVRGTQQIEAVAGPTHDGVFAAWYGKGPGVDRSGDALKHGNYAGSHRNGGVLVFFGDDHPGKSSTIAHQSEQAMAASLIPSLYPAHAGEIVEFGLLGYALSRYSGCWVGIKCVNETVEQTVTAEIDIENFATVSPETGPLPPEGLNIRVGGVLTPLRDEVIVTDYRLPLVRKFVRANRIDRTLFRSDSPRLGLVTAGKSYGDVHSALGLLGLDEAAAKRLGISLYKVGCIWPLEPEGLAEFAEGHALLFVVEEKKSFLEAQAATVLINQAKRPLIIGKNDLAGARLLDASVPHQPRDVALALARVLADMGILDGAVRDAAARLAETSTDIAGNVAPIAKRTPFFCSGCPHNRSVRVPEGSVAMAGIGCHNMANWVRPEETLTATHMGAEGANWIGLAPFTETKHIFQNMGDGTYFHSGLMAIRAAVAARVNITYKILYNDAVAMTGGQPIDGPISVAEIIQQVLHEGIAKVVLVTDNPAQYAGDSDLPTELEVHHRDELDAVQRSLRDVAGVTVLVYEQTCAAEKRRRRKRGKMPDPPKRLFIAEAVCEACGDCSVQSTCVSLTPQPTAFGTKRRIDQTSCNKDYSCLNGFCPSFLTVEGVGLRKSERGTLDQGLFNDLPDPIRAEVGKGNYNLLMTGIGGTGVITVGAILGMAAHVDGLAASIYDMTGMAQKNGAVQSHIRIARDPAALGAQSIGTAETDALLAFDLVAAVADDAAATLQRGRTRALVNSDVSSTVSFQFDRDAVVRPELLLARLGRLVGEEAVTSVPASGLADALLGSTVAANLMLLGSAAQLGMLPVTVRSIEQAIRLNGTGEATNLAAFALGRLLVSHPERVAELAAPREPQRTAVPATLAALVEHRAHHLEAYQDAAYAARFRALVGRVRQAEQRVAPGSDALAMAAARSYARLLAYKDEYEVARLLTSPALHAELSRTFEEGGKLSFNLAPPILSGKPVNRRPRKRAFAAGLAMPVLKVIARLKRLRGTALDPFGYSAERRMERGLIGEYEALVQRVLDGVTEANRTRAVELLSLAEQVRGFGPVKQAAVDAYRVRLAEVERGFVTDVSQRVVEAPLRAASTAKGGVRG